MGKGPGRPGSPGDRLDVPEVGESDGAGACQGAVAGGGAAVVVQRLCHRADLRGAAGAAGQHGTGLVADVGGTVVVAAQELRRDRVLGLLGAQVRVGVVGPLPGFVPSSGVVQPTDENSRWQWFGWAVVNLPALTSGLVLAAVLRGGSHEVLAAALVAALCVLRTAVDYARNWFSYLPRIQTS